MSSETHTVSSDCTAIQFDHECDHPPSTDITTTHLDKDYPSSNATLTTNNDINCNYGTRGTTRRNNYDSEDVVLLLFLLLCLSGMSISIYFISKPAYVPPLTFKVVSLQVASMTISNNPSYVSADLNLTLSLTNNKDQQLLIEPLVVSIMYDDEFLTSKKIDPLYLSGQNHNHKSIELDMGITASQLNVVTVDSISTDLAMNHSLVFKILIQGRYSILKSGDIYDDIYGVAITCDGVKVNFLLVESNLTAGSLINGPCSCKHINVT